MTEIEFGGRLEAIAKTFGHEGLLRVRSLNYEAYTWHVLSGSNGVLSASLILRWAGWAFPAFPVGASFKPMKSHEPILVDFGTCYHGYQTDETRMFSIGKMEEKFIEAYKACKEIHDSVLEDTCPGADCEAIFFKTVQLARSWVTRTAIWDPWLQTRFVAHGIGLELNEFPFLARANLMS